MQPFCLCSPLVNRCINKWPCKKKIMPNKRYFIDLFLDYHLQEGISRTYLASKNVSPWACRRERERMMKDGKEEEEEESKYLWNWKHGRRHISREMFFGAVIMPEKKCGMKAVKVIYLSFSRNENQLSERRISRVWLVSSELERV